MSDPHVVAAGDAPAEPPSLARLQAALAGRDSFIGAIGHELRNSVAPMLLLAEQLRAMADEPAAAPGLASRVALLTRNLGKLVTTIERVAEVAELRRGTMQLALTPVNLVEVVTEVCRAMDREAAAGGVTLVFEPTAPVQGTWDRDRIKQIVANLVSNAIRYGGGGRVEIAAVDRGTAGELIVRDHGPGLDPAMLVHLFDAFGSFALAPDGRRRTGGFGIGLWAVKTLCTAMQGSVTAENDPGGGARFCVVLPRG